MACLTKCIEDFGQMIPDFLFLQNVCIYYKKYFLKNVRQENYKELIMSNIVFFGQGIFSKNILLKKQKAAIACSLFKKEFPNIYTSIFAYLAWLSINSRRGGTSSPINIAKIRSASAALSIVTCFSERVSGFIVVLHNCSAFISPRPL